MLVALLAGPWQAIATAPEVPRIESVVLAPAQPHANNPNVIWYDDFDVDRIGTYLEPKAGSPDARRSTTEGLGGRGASMECFYGKGRLGTGNRKLVFGDCPFGKPLRPGEHFNDIYWRMYVKHQKGWAGAPAKMSRATGFVSSQWNQAFISHVWSSGLPLTLDPATGVTDGQVVTTVYNDFDHLRWLGNKPVGKFQIHATSESGRWVCVESRVRLNTPGQKDGFAALWVDGLLDTVRTNMDFLGTYPGRGRFVNGIFLEAYWNDGSPSDQYRWYDDFVVSTQPIGPVTAEPNPVLIKTPCAECAEWQTELASDVQGADVVWQSRNLPAPENRIATTMLNGKFAGTAHGRASLPPGLYFNRVRQKGQDGTWSAWSPWHQPFFVVKQTTPAPYLNIEKRSEALWLNLYGESAINYAIEASSDLALWSLLTNVAGSSIEFAAPQSMPQSAQGFFRARQ